MRSPQSQNEEESQRPHDLPSLTKVEIEPQKKRFFMLVRQSSNFS